MRPVRSKGVAATKGLRPEIGQIRSSYRVLKEPFSRYAIKYRVSYIFAVERFFFKFFFFKTQFSMCMYTWEVKSTQTQHRRLPSSRQSRIYSTNDVFSLPSCESRFRGKKGFFCSAGRVLQCEKTIRRRNCHPLNTTAGLRRDKG